METRYGSIAAAPAVPERQRLGWKGFVLALVVSMLIFASDIVYPVDLSPQNTTAAADSSAERAFDVIVVGSGPAGLVAAEFLSRDPKVNVLILEAGGPSLQCTGGKLVPPYANGTNLTYFDIPGEYANVAFMLPRAISSSWHMEWLESPKNHLAKLVGGSSSINAALYFRPPAAYLDEIQWPYSASDVTAGFAEIEKGFGWTDCPSTDGLWYAQDVYALMAAALKRVNYSEHKINQSPDLKHFVYGHPPFTIKHGLRDSPAKTFLGAMASRSNVVLETWATVSQVLHKGGKASGVSYTKGKTLLTAKLRSHHGAVLLAAGSLNTPKLLLQSGIGPKAQASLVHSLGLPQSGPWISNEAVGAHLFDTHQVAVTFRAPKAPQNAAGDRFGFDYLHPPQDAIDQFLADHSGPLASSNPVLISYESVVDPATAREYHFQITVFPHPVPHGDNSTADPMDFTLCFNLNNPTSQAALGFFPNASSPQKHHPVYGMLPTTALYWANETDLDMMVAFIKQTIARLAQVNTIPIFPPSLPGPVASSWDVSPHEWVRQHTLVTDHFGGTCAAGTDAASCVDASLVVRGTANVFVGDGSLVAGGSVNPYGFVMYSGYQASVSIKKHLTMSKARGKGKHNDDETAF